MKKLLLFLLVCLHTIAFAQTSNVNRLSIKDSLSLPGGWIKALSKDPSFEDAADYILPTQAAVKAYVDNNLNPVVASVSALTAYTGNSKSVFLSDPVQGGTFRYSTTSQVVDSGLVFPAPGGYWVRDWDGVVVNPRWYGARGDGVTDDSRAVKKVIERFKGIATNTAVTIQFSPGTYLLKDIPVPSGFKVCASQIATNNVDAFVPVKIKPATGAQYVFMVDSAAMNVTLENLYIDADYQHNPNLIAGVKFRGSFNNLNGNNIIRCPNYAVWSDCGSFRIINNNFQGQFAPNIPFSSYEDFHGALHIIAAGDSYLLNNEIGAAAPYLAGQVSTPDLILRDPLYKRIVSLYAGYLGNSYVSNNLFENGDQGAVINGGLYGNFSGNRYEMNAFRGLRLRNVYYTTFADEKFANNSLAINGAGEDIRLDTGAVAFCTFSHPTFVRLTHPAIPTSNFKVKYNIVNYTGAGGNTLISPNFAVETARYDSLGHFDNTIQAAPFNYIDGQLDPKSPVYSSATFGYTGDKDGSVKGGVRILPGTTTALGGRTGTIGFIRPDNNVSAQIGFNDEDNLNFTLFQPNKQFVFAGGSVIAAKSGANALSIQSNDVAGNTASLNLFANPAQTKGAGFTIGPDGTLSTYATDNMLYSLVNPGIYTFMNGGITTAKAGGTNVVLIGDNTGQNQIHLSSDGLATKAADITFNNVTGAMGITATSDITVGISHNWIFKANGLNYIPVVPTPASSNVEFLVRDVTTGEMQRKANVYLDSNQVKSLINSSAAPTPTLTQVTNAGNTTTNLINVGGIGSSGPAVFGGGIFPSLQVITASTSLNVGGYTTNIVKSATAVTIGLPNAADAINQVYIIKRGGGAGTVTIDPAGSELIDGVGTKDITTTNGSVIIQSTGSEWFILAQM